MKYMVLISVVLLFFPGSVHAIEDGHDLLQKCGPIMKLYSEPESLSSKEASGVVYCMGYIDSFIETFRFQVETQIVASVPYCMPSEKVPKKDIARVIVDYLKEHRDDLGKPAGYHIFMALREAFPCSKKAEKKE